MAPAVGWKTCYFPTTEPPGEGLLPGTPFLAHTEGCARAVKIWQELGAPEGQDWEGHILP